MDYYDDAIADGSYVKWCLETYGDTPAGTTHDA